MKLKFIGDTFYGGYAGLTGGKTYECIGTEYGLLRIIDDEGEDYLYSAMEPCAPDGSSEPGRWEIIEDDENQTLHKLFAKLAELRKQSGVEPPPYL